MDAGAEQLVDAALSEVAARDPNFLAREPVGFDPAALAATLSGWGTTVDEAALAAGLARLQARGLRIGEDGRHRELAEVLAASIADARAAESGELPLRPAPARALEAALAEDYERRSVDGVDYLVRRRGRRWLLLINALGIPLHLWSRLIADPDHDYRIVVVESACTPLLEGGMSSPEGLAGDAERIERVLEAEVVDGLTVIGWCSGGRVAVELAARQPDRVGGLVLASASFRGVLEVEPTPTQFEADVAGILGSVERQPSSAEFLSRMLVQSQGAAPQPTDAVSLFRLPAKHHAEALIAPLATPEQLQRYAARISADRRHATADALRRVRAPVLMVAGAHDHILDNAVTLAVLRAHLPAVTAVEVSGAGHYVHDLQYPYFRMLLDAFVEGPQIPPAARLRAI